LLVEEEGEGLDEVVESEEEEGLEGLDVVFPAESVCFVICLLFLVVSCAPSSSISFAYLTEN